MRLIATIFGMLFLAGNAYSLEFTSLSKYKPVQISYSTQNKAYVSFLLKFSSEKPLGSDLFIRVQYLVDNDTLNDYIYTDGEYEGVLKQFALDPGEKVTVNVFLNTSGVEIVNDLNGSLEMRKDEDADSESSEAKFAFAGTIWKNDNTPIFRINKASTEEKSLVLKFSLSENYEYDKIFVRVKVISPMQGILEIDKNQEVYSDVFLPYKGKTIEMVFPELHVDKPGNYYVQISHEHSAERINGIKSVAWELR